LAAASLAYVLDFKLDFDNLADFEKLDFRVQPVGEKQGRKFYNDSASTNPLSVIEAVKVMNESYCLIMGGSSKNLDFSHLAEFISHDQNCKKIYLFGQTADEISEKLVETGATSKTEKFTNLEEAFERAISTDGYNTILFSPGCASFDQYKNYTKRGEHFNSLVEKL